MVVDLQSAIPTTQAQQQQQQTLAGKSTDSVLVGAEGGPAVRVVGPRATVESARMLLGVVLEYMDQEREMREGDAAVRERLLVSFCWCRCCCR